MTALELIGILQGLPPETRILTVGGNEGDECETNAFVELPEPGWTCEGSPYIVICGEGDDVSLEDDGLEPIDRLLSDIYGGSEG